MTRAPARERCEGCLFCHPLPYSRIARATGATIVHRTDELQESDVGTKCGLMEVRKIGDEFFVFMEECAEPRLGWRHPRAKQWHTRVHLRNVPQAEMASQLLLCFFLCSQRFFPASETS